MLAVAGSGTTRRILQNLRLTADVVDEPQPKFKIKKATDDSLTCRHLLAPPCSDVSNPRVPSILSDNAAL